MRDGLGKVDTIAIIGAPSDIGTAIARRLEAEGSNKILLAGRPSGRLDDLAATFTSQAQTVAFDVAALDTHDEATRSLFSAGDVDVVVFAAGRLIPNPTVTETIEMATVNYLGTLSALQHVAEAMKSQGHGQLVVMSSAGITRPRAANYLYASSKLAMDFAARGLADLLAGSTVTVTVVRPGYVHTKMTEGIRPTPMSSTTDEVAEAVYQAVVRQRGGVVWVPRQITLLAWLLGIIPGPLLRKLP